MSDQLRKVNRARDEQNLRERYDKGHRYWTEYRIEGKLPLVRGRRFKIEGDSGYYIFHYAARDNGGDWISADGPHKKNALGAGSLSRCFDPKVVKQVERTMPTTEYAIETVAERAERLGLNEIGETN